MVPNFSRKTTKFFRKMWFFFSDETVVELFSSAKIYVRRPPNMRYYPNYITSTAKFGGRRVMFWGYIKFSGERDIVVIDGSINSAKYCKLLETHLIENIYLDEIFQQDNASCHNSKFTTNFFPGKWFSSFGKLAPAISRFEYY